MHARVYAGTSRQYLQSGQYQLPGGSQHGPMAVGKVQQGPHALDVLGGQLTEGQTGHIRVSVTKELADALLQRKITSERELRLQPVYFQIPSWEN